MGHVYEAVVDIDAPPDAVMAVLTDLERYPEWNPFTPRVRSALEDGAPVFLTVRLNGRLVEQVEHFRATDAQRELVWAIRTTTPWLLHAERVQRVLLRPDGGAIYQTRDTIGGWLLPIVKLLYGSSLERGFREMAEALKERVESVSIARSPLIASASR